MEWDYMPDLVPVAHSLDLLQRAQEVAAQLLRMRLVLGQDYTLLAAQLDTAFVQ
jgi:hypothetical protein